MPPLLPTSISCQDGMGEKRELSPNHGKNRRKGVKYATRVIVRDESSLLRVCERAKSRSPRRNSWREEISKIRNWKDEKEITKECLTQKNGAARRRVQLKYLDEKCCKKLARKAPRFLAAGKKKNNETRKQEQRIMIECKKERQSSLPSDRLNKNVISDGKESNIGVVVKMVFSTSMDIQGELPEVKEIGDHVRSDEAVKQPAVTAMQILDCEVFAKAYGPIELLENKINRFSATSSASSMAFDKDAGALARSFSLLELKMEVFTTRLRELEWEREQIRKERDAMQGPKRTMMDSN